MSHLQEFFQRQKGNSRGAQGCNNCTEKPIYNKVYQKTCQANSDRLLSFFCICSFSGIKKSLTTYCDEALRGKRRLPTLPLLRSTIGVTGLNFSVRNGKRWNPGAIVTLIRSDMMSSKTDFINCNHAAEGIYPHAVSKTSQRAISNARLWRHRLYTCILSTSSSLTTLRNLILWPASHLDAFSAYPIPT